MDKKHINLIISLGILIVFAGGIYCFGVSKENKVSHDARYFINGEEVTLKNGISEEAVPNSSAKVVTRYFGNDVKYDLDKDGTEDSVFIITQSTGGSGTFYYVVALLNTKNGPVGSHGLLLGDRISPQSTSMGKGNIVVVNYADRKNGESFSVAPSVGKSIWLLLDTKTMQFGEVAQNFEGEADPDRMKLSMKTWVWNKTVYSDDKEVKPRLESFSLTFKDDKSFAVTTDCNSMGGMYTLTDKSITFGNIFSTKMYCENSQETDFVKMLEQTQSYLFTSKGELVLVLKFDSGSVFFR